MPRAVNKTSGSTIVYRNAAKEPCTNAVEDLDPLLKHVEDEYLRIALEDDKDSGLTKARLLATVTNTKLYHLALTQHSYDADIKAALQYAVDKTGEISFVNKMINDAPAHMQKTFAEKGLSGSLPASSVDQLEALHGMLDDDRLSDRVDRMSTQLGVIYNKVQGQLVDGSLSTQPFAVIQAQFEEDPQGPTTGECEGLQAQLVAAQAHANALCAIAAVPAVLGGWLGALAAAALCSSLQLGFYALQRKVWRVC